MLFLLPRFIHIPLLKEWLPLESFGFLDSAMCNHKDRSKLLRILSSDFYDFKTAMVLASQSYLTWLKVRNIAVNDEVTIGSRILDDSSSDWHFNSKLANSIKKLHIMNFTNLMESVLKAISGGKSQLRELCFEDSSDLDDTILSELLTKCAQLTSLTVVSCSKIEGRFMRILQRSCPSLMKLHIEKCEKVEEFERFDTGLRMLNLTDVIVVKEGYINYSKSICLMLASTPNITSLRINNRPETWISDKTFLKMIECLPNIRHFNLLPSDIVMRKLAECCPYLEEVVLDENIEPEILASYLSAAQCLRSIDFQYTPASNLLPIISANSPHLTSITLSAEGLSEDVLILFLQECKTLEILVLMQGYQSLDDIPIAIAQNGAMLTSLTLEYFTEITDDAINILTQSCTKLRNLHLPDCHKLTDTAFEYIAKQLAHLSTLSFSYSTHGSDAGLTDAALKSFITYGRQLKDVKFDLCYGFTDNGMSQFIEHCGRNLTRFSMRLRHLKKKEMHKIKITDETILKLALVCIHLSSFHLTCNPHVTFEALKILFFNCKNLRHANIHACEKIEERHSEELRDIILLKNDSNASFHWYK